MRPTASSLAVPCWSALYSILSIAIPLRHISLGHKDGEYGPVDKSEHSAETFHPPGAGFQSECNGIERDHRDNELLKSRVRY